MATALEIRPPTRPRSREFPASSLTNRSRLCVRPPGQAKNRCNTETSSGAEEVSVEKMS